jgi:hypothetical protein
VAWREVVIFWVKRSRNSFAGMVDLLERLSDLR